ncbi:hypothetical protein GCM10009646_42180 [Streptomyces aureus]
MSRVRLLRTTGAAPAVPAAPDIVLRDPCLVKPLRTTLSVTAPTGAYAQVKRVRDWARTMGSAGGK